MDRGSATRVIAWQMAQRIDWAPGGSCNGVRQLEQSTSINILEGAVGELREEKDGGLTEMDREEEKR